MVNSKNRVVKEIRILKSKINNHTHNKDYSKEIQKLSYFTLQVHSIAEFRLGDEIFKKMLFTAHTAHNAKSKLKAIESINKEFVDISYKIMSGYSFKRKLDLAKGLKVINSNTYDKLDSLNNLRNDLAHLSNNNFKKYNDLDLYKEALLLIYDCVRIGWFGEKIYKSTG